MQRNCFVSTEESAKGKVNLAALELSKSSQTLAKVKVVMRSSSVMETGNSSGLGL
jgi:hypothetical protein